VKIDRLVRRSLVHSRPPSYPGADPRMLRMDANTNLYGMNPVVGRALRAGVWKDVNHYPSGLNDELRGAVADHYRLRTTEVMVGDGSDELLDVVMKTFCEPGDVVAAPVPTFVMYAFYARVNGARFAGVPLGPGWSLDPKKLLSTRAKITFIASPNNPTGNAHAYGDIEAVLRGTHGLVVVDEAYAEFCGHNWLPRIREFPNLIVTRTFSKSHGLAGLRVGFCAASREIMDRLYTAKTPFTISAVSERIAVAALKDRGYLRGTLAMLAKEKPFLAGGLEKLGFRPYRSDANFLLTECPVLAEDVVRKLKERKILVRYMGDMPRLENCIRLTVGRREHNVRLLRALAGIVHG
jgi:histidinol-phosphate aminotransferase